MTFIKCHSINSSNITGHHCTLTKRLNDELKYFVCYNFSLRLRRIPREFLEFSMFKEIPEYSRFCRFVATLYYCDR